MRFARDSPKLATREEEEIYHPETAMVGQR